MLLRDLLMQSVAAASRHRSRTILILFELVVGTCAVALVSNVSGAVTRQDMEARQVFDESVIVLQPEQFGVVQQGGAGSGIRTWDLVTSVPGLQAATRVTDAVVSFPWQIYDDDRYVRGASHPVGLSVDRDFARVFRPEMLSGSWFSESDAAARTPGIIMTAHLARRTFGTQDAVGLRVEVNRGTNDPRTLTVVGVVHPNFRFPAYGYLPAWIQDEEFVAFVPDWVAPPRPGARERFWARAADAGSAARVATLVKTYLDKVQRERGGVAWQAWPSTRGLDARKRELGWMVGVLSWFSWSVLLVAGLGLAGLMLIGVTERWQEIGLRTALGATPGSVLGQFMCESVVVCVAGGVPGLALALAVVSAVSPDNVPRLASLWPYAKALAATLSVGVAATTYPALKAALVLPASALQRRL